MINRLTPEQQARLAQVHGEWLAAGTSTSPADRSTAEEAVRDAYHEIGEASPIILWALSPMGAILLKEFLEANLWANLRDNLEANLRDNLRANLWANLEANLRDNLGANLGANLRANLRANLGANLRDNLWDNLWECWHYGAHDSAWIAFYTFCHEIGAGYSAKNLAVLQIHVRLCQSALWIWSYRGVTIICERPTVLRLEPAPFEASIQRLHASDGPAMAFGDGYSVYAVHGVRVAERVVKREYTASDITSELNIEVRRVMLDLYGTDRYIQEIGAKPFHRDDWGTLYRVQHRGDEDLCMVRIVNGTPEPDGTDKDYWLRVPPTTETALEGVAWTYEVSPAQYAQLIERT